ncbi:sodium:proton exchanger [Vibrio albus]|uniref:Sodium:proton exchanger n=1 Tax=Vibrio albus TaxID=2200953 RepID=A0A2U3BBF9_9VIBR|nr:cation:proton antiporter [Vibrio albus]PWI34113.1 sodium:proton exchanger [Vibrio albus]
MQSDKVPDLLILGVLFLIGWTAHIISSKAHIPRVTILLCIGIVSGPTGLNLIPAEFSQYFHTVSHLALAMVGFLLGESFFGRDIISERWQILFISLGVSLVPAICVFIAILLITSNLSLALVLAGIATATDPAATIDVIREFKAKGPVSRILKSVVAVDDAWGIIIFSLLLVVASNLNGGQDGIIYIIHGFREIAGALSLGIAIGIPMSYIIGRNRPGEPTVVEAMGFVFICGGSALYLEVSYLLACMTLGATVSRMAKHIERPFYDIETASDPFLIIFFILSGISLDFSTFHALGYLMLTYIIARTLGKWLGAQLSSRLTKAPSQVIHHLGGCLLPQAGVAIGMALLVSERFPELGDTILTIAVTTTVLFELFGPLATHWNLNKAGEMPGKKG